MTGNRAGGRAGGGKGASPPSPPPRGRAGAGARVYAPAGRGGGSSLPPARPLPGQTSGPGGPGPRGERVVDGARGVDGKARCNLLLPPAPPHSSLPPRSRAELGGDGGGGLGSGGGAGCNYRPAQARGIHISQS